MTSYPPPQTPPQLRSNPPRSDSLPRARPTRSDSLPRKPSPIYQSTTPPTSPPTTYPYPTYSNAHLSIQASPRLGLREEEEFAFQPRRLFMDESRRNASQETIEIGLARGGGDVEVPSLAYSGSPKMGHRPEPLLLDSSTNNIDFSTELNSDELTPPSSSSDPPASSAPKKPLLVPSIRLLFSLNTRSTNLTIILPAILLSIITGLVPPYMTETLGNAFGAFTTYTLTVSAPLTPLQLSAARTLLLEQAKTVSIKFGALAAVVLLSGWGSMTLWAVNGERIARGLREGVYKGVCGKGLEWFDLGMGSEEGNEEGQGAGGLMGRFTKETDEVRIATSRTIGLIIQYLVSFLACLILSFYRNFKLTFVILATVPLITIFVGLTERFANPLNWRQNVLSSMGSTFVDRTIGAIPTVKAFNAERMELDKFDKLQKDAARNYSVLHFIWGIRTGVTQFLLFAMFVQGFWFGSYLISKGQSTPSAVNTCFWSCLLASTYLQICVPMLVELEKGKIAMASLLSLAREEEKEVVAVLAKPIVKGRAGRRRRNESESSVAFAKRGSNQEIVDATMTKDEEAFGLSPHPFQVTFPSSLTSPTSPTLIPLSTTLTSSGKKSKSRKRQARTLRKLRPAHFSGELGLKDVTFHYPSRPHPAPPALKDVSLFLASQETTYIVGGSGSGKSTVGSLLLGLYKPELGRVEVDGQGLEWIEETWLRGHVGCVSQGASVLFEGTVHDNVAIGVTGQIRPDGTTRKVEEVTREEVVSACRGALVHEFIRDLPEGYDTVLSGEKGASLSGGQRQRLALARAWIRDPTVLILDEATSALDATSRLLVSEAVKQWRKNRTTIIITHDLTPIEANDFVYVMENGVVVEQGYREALQENFGGPFWKLVHTNHGDDGSSMGEREDEEEMEALGTPSVLVTPPRISSRTTTPHATPRSISPATPKTPQRNDVDSSLMSRTSSSFTLGLGLTTSPGDLSQLREARRKSANFTEMQERRASGQLLPPHLLRNRSPSPRREEPPQYDRSYFRTDGRRDSSMSFTALDQAAKFTSMRRTGGPRIKHKTMVFDNYDPKETKGGMEEDSVVIEVGAPSVANVSFSQVIRRMYPLLPSKFLFISGLILSVIVGACTPVFSTLLSSLMANLGNPNSGNLVIRTSLLILLVAFIEGFGTLMKFWMLEKCAMDFVTSVRVKAMGKLLKQDKAYFDDPENTTSHISHLVIQDSVDSRPVIGTVLGQFMVILSMLIIGLVWAVAVGWELTLVGFALCPVFLVSIRAQAYWQAKYEAQNKVLRESVAKKFHNSVSNVRAIRSMAIESVFSNKFLAKNEETYRGALRVAPIASLGFAIGSCLTYATEAVMFYVGAIFIANGRYDFARVAQVFSLIIFSLTFASQIMNYVPGLTKGTRAFHDFARLLELKEDSAESEGRMTFPIQGKVTFDRVEFSYPSRPDVPILRGISFEVKAGECVGVVGASGSGKSTIAGLLQRLYEPSRGTILLDGRPLRRMDVRYLRDHIGMVSQHPALFDMSISANIAYGCVESVSQDSIEAAAKSAHLHDFIVSLPKGYQTMLGENASLISGGQAQRLQIARALLRRREILILDEATSALDPTNQAAVMETIMSAKEGKTTFIITHKLAVMEKCDRLIVIGPDGTVAETGTVVELRARTNGLFASLATGGEWEG